MNIICAVEISSKIPHPRIHVTLVHTGAWINFRIQNIPMKCSIVIYDYFQRNVSNLSKKKQAIPQHIVLTNGLTLGSQVFLENLTFPELVKEFPVVYKTRTFVTLFVAPSHLSLRSASPVQFTSLQLITLTLILQLIYYVCVSLSRFSACSAFF